MSELFGRAGRRKDLEILKKINRASKRLFFLVFMLGSIWFIFLLSQSKAELTPRAALHAFTAN